MKFIRLAVLSIILIIVFLIYINTLDKKIYYISLGDSFSLGKNPYGNIGYGYSDYIANYLEKNKLLEFYTKDFAISGYQSNDLINAINNNKKININNKKISIKNALVKADLVTISIGNDEIYYKLGINDMSYNLAKNNDVIINEISNNIEKTIKLVRQYCKEDIIIIGCYNPLARVSSTYLRELEPTFININNKIKNIAIKYKLHYVNIYDIFKENPEYLPNPNDFHPSTDGYEVISSQIINIIEKDIIN
jgi:lysophospholipase L1-like esterase